MFDYATGKWMPVRFYDFITKKWSDGHADDDAGNSRGDYDPVLGGTFLQIAREGWALQKSQNGGGGIPLAGPAADALSPLRFAGAAADKEQSFFDGVDVSLGGIADLAQGPGQRDGLKDRLAGECAGRAGDDEFSAAHPEEIAPMLAEGLKQTNALVAQVSASNLSEQAKYDVLHELAVKQEQFQQAIALALGVSLEATVRRSARPARGNFYRESAGVLCFRHAGAGVRRQGSRGQSQRAR